MSVSKVAFFVNVITCSDTVLMSSGLSWYTRCTEQTIVTDCGVCSWPWLALTPTDYPVFVTSNHWIWIKHILGWSPIVFCACKIIQLFSVVFGVVRAVHEFDVRLVINGTPNKWPVEGRSCSDRDSCFARVLHNLCFSPDCRLEC